MAARHHAVFGLTELRQLGLTHDTTTRAGIDVIVPRSVARNYPGIDVHRSVTLTDQDVTAIDSIPVTTLTRKPAVGRPEHSSVRSADLCS